MMRASAPTPFVIPAQAGIPLPSGNTQEQAATPHSRGRRMMRASLPTPFVIPAKAGIPLVLPAAHTARANPALAST